MKKQGFTLVELLAVIVIIAVVALITIPMILNVIEEARKNSYKESARGYVDAIEKRIVKEQLKNTNTDYTGMYSIREEKITKTSETATLIPILDTISLTLKIKGTLPDKGNVVIDKKGVTSGKFYYGDYLVTLNGEKYNVEIVTNGSTDSSDLKDRIDQLEENIVDLNNQLKEEQDKGKTVLLRFSGSQALTCNSTGNHFTNMTVNRISDNSNHIFTVSNGIITIKKAGYYHLSAFAYLINGTNWRNVGITINGSGSSITSQTIPTGTGNPCISSSTDVYLNANSTVNIVYWCSSSNTMQYATLSATYLHS